MKHVFALSALIASALIACNQTQIPNNSPKVLGVLEVRFAQDGYASAKLQQPLKTQAVSFRETDFSLGSGNTQVITSTDSAYTYLVASFNFTNTSSSQVFQNLTLYALAKNGNLGGTALKSISNWGGITNVTEQTRQARLAIPVSPISSALAIDTLGSFQAFTSAEVAAATSAATTAGAMTAGDTLLNYGFNARCTSSCVANSRQIGVNGAGILKVAMRVPNSASVYGFRMTFLVFDESESRVTRSVFPSESIAAAETRGTGVSATRLMQFGLKRGTTSLASDVVDDVLTSTLNTSIHALGIGRISAGTSHSCGLDSTGQAYCWGRGTEGQLGNGTIISTTTPSLVSGGHTFSSISAGSRHTCALTTAGAGYCWGDDTYGRLGDDTLTATGSTSTTPSPVAGGYTFSSISAGQFHTCGLNVVGKAYCWGEDSSGQLGDNTLTTDSTTPTPVDGGYVFSSISAGGFHSCGVTTAGAAYCWGSDSNGQLGNGAPTVAFVAPSAVSGGLTFSSIEAGANHTCALTTAGAAYCWGLDTDGQLGDASTTTGATTPSAVASGYTYSSISAGGSHGCGVTTAGVAYCWGSDASGQLGDGTTSTGTTAPSAVDKTDFTL